MNSKVLRTTTVVHEGVVVSVSVEELTTWDSGGPRFRTCADALGYRWCSGYVHWTKEAAIAAGWLEVPKFLERTRMSVEETLC